MKHTNTIFAVGAFFMLMPFLGFPTAWKNFFVFFLGLLLCWLVISDRFNAWQIKKSRQPKEKFVSSAVPFVENRNRFDSSSDVSSPKNNEQTS